MAIVVFHVYQTARSGPDSAYPYAGTIFDTVLVQFDGFVDLFFVLSAFLLSLPYMRSSLQGQDSPNAKAFLVRRAARVVPLYMVAVTVVWAWRNSELPGDWVDLVLHLTFTQVFDQERIFYTIGPAWSLAVEVQFYLLLAVLGHLACLACVRLPAHRRRQFLTGGLVVIGLASVLWKVVAWYVLGRPEDDWVLWFGLLARLDVFVLGMALALVVADGRVRLGGKMPLMVRVVSLLVVLAAFLTRPQGAGPDVWFHLFVGVGFVLLLASSVLGPSDRWVRALSARVPTLLGLVSYSLYIWHEPVLLALHDLGLVPPADSALAFPVGVAVLVPVSLAVAWVSYWLIEYPASALRTLVQRDGTPRKYYAGE